MSGSRFFHKEDGFVDFQKLQYETAKQVQTFLTNPVSRDIARGIEEFIKSRENSENSVVLDGLEKTVENKEK